MPAWSIALFSIAFVAMCLLIVVILKTASTTWNKKTNEKSTEEEKQGKKSPKWMFWKKDKNKLTKEQQEYFYDNGQNYPGYKEY